MSYRFSKRSIQRLEGVDERLRAIVNDVMALQVMDFSVSEGLRTKERQRKLVTEGKSKTMNSKHLLGLAVDIYPYPVDMQKVMAGNWVELARFGVLAGLMKAVANRHGVRIRWGLEHVNPITSSKKSFVEVICNPFVAFDDHVTLPAQTLFQHSHFLRVERVRSA